MCENYGINLSKKKILIECRMTKELEKRGLTSFTEYMNLLEKEGSGELAGEMVSRLTTNYTYFFRESEHFDYLQDQVLPKLCGQGGRPFWNFWCAGCSTGEECYTLAMTVRDFLDKSGRCAEVRILGTDVSEAVLRQAEKAEYSVASMEGLPGLWRTKYCHREGENSFAIDSSLKQMVRFRKRNLLDPLVERERFSLILCRNVMIYFDRSSREKAVKNLENSLAPGGYLFTGHAELLSGSETVLNNICPAVYQKNGAEER